MQIERNIVFWSAALAVFVGLLWLLSPILLPFVLGMAIAYLLDPLNRRLTKRGMSRTLASFIILAGFVLAFVLLLLLITPPLMRQLSSFIDNAPAYAQRLQALVSDPNHPWLKRIVGDNLASGSAGDLMNQAMGYLTGVLGFAVGERPGADFDLFAFDHHAGRRILSELRLGSDRNAVSTN